MERSGSACEGRGSVVMNNESDVETPVSRSISCTHSTLSSFEVVVGMCVLSKEPLFASASGQPLSSAN
jgi:hypothetical protein